MENQTKQPAKKKSKFRSFLTWVLVIFLSLHLLTDGESTESLKALFERQESGHTTQLPGSTTETSDDPAYLGISVSDSNDPQGVCVHEVEPEGSAHTAGILPGDIIVSLDDRPITCAADLASALSGYHAGQRAKIIVLRGNDRLVLTVRFQEKLQDVTQESLRPDPSKEPTKETGTPPTSAPVVDRLPFVPDNLRSHVYLDARGRGYCEALTGDVVITVIFVNDPEASWTNKQMDAAKSDLQAAISRITSDAKTYGAQVNITLKYKTGTASVNITDAQEDWINGALKTAGLPDQTNINLSLEAAYQVEAAPVIFFANHGGRALAHTLPSGNEYAILYETADAFYHELSHIFGAKDFYYPDEVEDLAAKHLSDSIMLDSSNGKMESFTAYLIGWTDTLSSEALAFLKATSYLTYDYLAAEKEKESYTGYVEDFSIGNATYTGYLLDGVRHGQGKWTQDGTVWEGNWVYGYLQGSGTYKDSNGSTYAGEFKDSNFHGQGTYVFSNGIKYVGEFKNGSFHGQGTYTWENGAYYQGQHKDGQFNGYGIMVYYDGARYEGQWVNSKRNGKGTIVFADGSKYEGQWKDDVRQGQGTLTYADGGKYTGQWENNKQSGQGTYVYSNGNKYVGEWSDNKPHGQGVLTYADGHKYEGAFRNGLRHGKGTFTWAGGDRYTGDYVDGYRQGYGVYIWANGNKYEGEFYNNQFHGQGTLTYTNGTVKSGTWDNGKLVE